MDARIRNSLVRKKRVKLALSAIQTWGYEDMTC